MKINNPVQLRAYARALEHMPYVERVSPLVLNMLPIPTFYHHLTQQLRAVAQYPVQAIAGVPYIRTVRRGKGQWLPEGIPQDWADLEMHTMHVTLVATLGDAFEPIHLSRANHPRQYRDFSFDQHAHGIDWQHPDWIHPLDRYTKDVMIHSLLNGEPIQISDTLIKEIEIFREDEHLILIGANTCYNKDTERQLA